jgi:hypothetical protein
VHDKFDANDDDPWQIHGSRLLETPLCQAIPQLDNGSSTSLARRFGWVA